MKKFLIALALGIVLVLALATVASADNGPHGGFNGSTDACAGCHRAHSGQDAGGFLLVASDIYTLCMSCHDGTGALTNARDGYYDTAAGDAGKTDSAVLAAASANGTWGESGYGLLGGGFVNARMLTDYGNAGNEAGLANDTFNLAADQNASLVSWARMNAYDTTTLAPTSRPTTSNHGVALAPRTGTVWGSGDYNSVNVTFTGATELECSSCHNPHGNAGHQGGQNTGAPYPTYRILRFEPEGSAGFDVASQIGIASYWDTDLAWNGAAGAAFAGLVVDTTGDGVTVPDPATTWYTINSNVTNDSSLVGYRARGSELYTAIFAGRGDYMGRYWSYKSPAVLEGATAGGGVFTRLSCDAVKDDVPSDDCNATTTYTYNNVGSHDALGFWCATCHDRYLAPGGASRTTDSGDANYHYRHRSQGIPNSGGLGTGQYTCVDCHVAHGTAATASSTMASAASYATGSVLLKGDNRAVCVRCHAGAVNFFNVTTSPTAEMYIVTIP